MKKLFALCLALSFVFSLHAKTKEYKGEEAQNLLRPPLLRMTDSGYRLIWNDNAKGEQSVKLGRAKQKPVTIEAKKGRALYKDSGFYADLDNLEPGEKYWVQIKGHKKINFTAPKSPESELSFNVISDHQTYVSLTEKGFKLLASEKPDFVISCGDMLEDGKVKYWHENFFSNLPILEGIPFGAAEGNNDTGRNLFESFLALENRWYSTTYGMARFIFLDSNLPLRKDSEQYQWLEEVLKNNTSRWTFVVYHHATYLSVEVQSRYTKNRPDVTELFEKYKVDAVFNGHVHFYDRTTPINGVTYITLPSMSGKACKAELYKDSGFYGNQISLFNGYGSACLTKDKLSMQIKNLKGEIVDEFEITK